MKIVLSNYRYFVSGGPEAYMFAIDGVLRGYGHEVIPFSVQSPANRPTRYEAEFLSPIGNGEGAYFEDYKLKPGTIAKVLARQFYSPEAFRTAKAFVRKYKPDLVYSLHYLNKMSPAVIDGFRAAKVPVVVRISDFGLICPQAHLFDGNHVCEMCIKGNFLHAVRKRCIMRSRSAGLVKGAAIALQRLLGCNDRIDAFVFPSRFTLEKFKEAGFPERKLYCVPTPIDTKTITPVSQADGPFLYFGRLSPEKGVHHLLAAYRAIPGDKPALNVIGGRAGTDYAEKLMDEYKEVTFVDFMDKAALKDHVARAFCVIIPSVWYDNMPNVLLEAYANGKAVIAPAHGSFLDLVEDGKTGLLFEPGLVGSLRDKLMWAASHGSEIMEMGHAARRKAESEYTFDKHYENLMSIFTAVLR